MTASASGPASALTVPRDLRELTSIRFFAALYVILFHIYDHLPWLYNLPGTLLANGYLGVDLFFILSGVILTHVNIGAVRSGRFAYVPFMVHRLARIYPLHLVMFLAFVLLYQAARIAGMESGTEGEAWGYAPQHLLLIHAWGTTGGHAWNGPSWSISAEFFAYLTFPLSMLLAGRLSPRLGLALSVLLLVGLDALLRIQTGRGLAQLSFDFGIVRIIPEFLIGVFLYLVMCQTRISAGAIRLLIPAVAILYLLAAQFDLPDVVLILIMAALIFVLGLSALSDTPTVMKHPVLVYLGEISYSTYMVHYIFLIVAITLSRRLFGGTDFALWYWLGMIACMYLASAISYHLIELPARRLIRRLVAGRAPKPQ